MNVGRAVPGDLARAYAKKKGWELKRLNVMVEGDSDVRYFDLAANLYKKKTGLQIIGQDMSIFAAGTASSGGTDGIYEEFPVLKKIIQIDCDSNGKALFRLIALIDNDRSGRSLYRSLLEQYRSIYENRDIFLLKRVFPRTASECHALTSQMAKFNSEWKDIDCEIEDLISRDLINVFIEEEPTALIKPCEIMERHHHHEFTSAAKGRLFQFVKSYASLVDLEDIIDILKSLRYYSGLKIEGIV